jgi:hypothetical protein
VFTPHGVDERGHAMRRDPARSSGPRER